MTFSDPPFSITCSQDGSGETMPTFWWTSCAHRVWVLDPIGTVLQDFTQFIETSKTSRTKLRVVLNKDGLVAWKKIRAAKIPTVQPEKDEVAEVPGQKMTSAPFLEGWTAREFVRGKKGETNIHNWLLSLPAIFKKRFSEDLVDCKGDIKICPKGGTVQVLNWNDVAARAPMYFDSFVKAQAIQYGIQVSWQLFALVPQKDKCSCKAKIHTFCETVIKTTPPLLPNPDAPDS